MNKKCPQCGRIFENCKTNFCFYCNTSLKETKEYKKVENFTNDYRFKRGRRVKRIGIFLGGSDISPILGLLSSIQGIGLLIILLFIAIASPYVVITTTMKYGLVFVYQYGGAVLAFFLFEIFLVYEFIKEHFIKPLLPLSLRKPQIAFWDRHPDLMYIYGFTFLSLFFILIFIGINKFYAIMDYTFGLYFFFKGYKDINGYGEEEHQDDDPFSKKQ